MEITPSAITQTHAPSRHVRLNLILASKRLNCKSPLRDTTGAMSVTEPTTLATQPSSTKPRTTSISMVLRPTRSICGNLVLPILLDASLKTALGPTPAPVGARVAWLWCGTIASTSISPMAVPTCSMSSTRPTSTNATPIIPTASVVKTVARIVTIPATRS